MIEHIVLVIALVILGSLAIYISMRPRGAVELIIKAFLPRYKVIKTRKKAKKKVKGNSGLSGKSGKTGPFGSPGVEEKKAEEVFP